MTIEERDSGADQRKGLFDSLKTLAGTLLAIGRTRLELLSTELEEERLRLSSMLLWTLIALFCAGIGIIMITAFFVVLLWDTNRLLALGIPASLFLLGSVISWRVVVIKASIKPRLFSSSIVELSKDSEQLTSRS